MSSRDSTLLGDSDSEDNVWLDRPKNSGSASDSDTSSNGPSNDSKAGAPTAASPADQFSRSSSSGSEQTAASGGGDLPATAPPPKMEPSYWTLPRRDQILVLVICRLIEPLAYTSVAPYLYYMISSFGYTSPSTISALGTVVVSGFALGQAATGVLWGSLSDRYGRKPVLMCGLVGTALSTLLFGLSTNIYMATLARLLAGTLNGNVGVMRTMIAEIVKDHKEYQTRAFTVMPITFNIGTILGPVIGGLLADPSNAYPGSWIAEIRLFQKFPYLLPNIFPLPLLFVAMALCMLFLEETLDGPQVLWPVYNDAGLKTGRKVSQWIKTLLGRGGSSSGNNRRYEAVPTEDRGVLHYSDRVDGDDYEEEDSMERREQPQRPLQVAEAIELQDTTPLGIRDVLTKPVRVTIACYTLLMLHCPTFLQLLPIFMATPRIIQQDFVSPPPSTDLDERALKEHLPLVFNGGLGMPPSRIGTSMAFMGMTGIFLQFAVYPRVANKFGSALAHRLSLVVFPIAYIVAPFTGLLTRRGYNPSGGDGTHTPPLDDRWSTLSAIVPVAMFVILGRTFAIPPMPVLLTNAAAETNRSRALGKIHGLASSVTSAAKCVGPFLIGNLYSWGVHIGVIGLAWWVMALVVFVEIYVARDLREWGTDERMRDIERKAEEEESFGGGGGRIMLVDNDDSSSRSSSDEEDLFGRR